MLYFFHLALLDVFLFDVLFHLALLNVLMLFDIPVFNDALFSCCTVVALREFVLC